MNIFYDDSGTILSWAGRSPAPPGLHTLSVDEASISMQALIDGAYHVADGELVWGAVDLEAVAAKVRMQRNALLEASGWTQLPDAPVDREAWAAYRQALRDIPEQPGFPDNINWPAKPE